MPVKVLLLAFFLTMVTVAIHSFGTHVLLTRCTFLFNIPITGDRSWPRMVGKMGFLVIALLSMHLAEAGCWALAFYSGEMFPDFSTSAYYSLTCYSTVGFGDVLLPSSSRLLGPIESVVGVLMLGWSTAVIVACVQKIYRDAIQA